MAQTARGRLTQGHVGTGGSKRTVRGACREAESTHSVLTIFYTRERNPAPQGLRMMVHCSKKYYCKKKKTLHVSSLNYFKTQTTNNLSGIISVQNHYSP